MAARSKGGKQPSHSSKAPAAPVADSSEDDEDSGGSPGRPQFADKSPRQSQMPKRRVVEESDDESVDVDNQAVDGFYDDGEGEEAEEGEEGEEGEEDEGEEEGEDEGEEEGEDEGAPSADGQGEQDVAKELQEQKEAVASYKKDVEKLRSQKEAVEAKNGQLVAEVEALKKVGVAQKREIDRLRKKAGEGTGDGSLPCNQGRKKKASAGDEPDPKRPRAQYAPTRSIMAAAQDPNDFGLALILPENLSTVEVPHSYKGGPFSFPHRIENRAGLPVNVVESRNKVTLACQLRNVSLERNATPEELPAKDAVCFKLEVFLAAGGAALTGADLRTPIANLFDPPESATAVKNMTKDGMVKWNFRCNFLSRATKPTINQEFVLRLTCTNPELAAYPISAETPPFVVISREIKKKKTA